MLFFSQWINSSEAIGTVCVNYLPHLTVLWASQWVTHEIHIDCSQERWRGILALWFTREQVVWESVLTDHSFAINALSLSLRELFSGWRLTDQVRSLTQAFPPIMMSLFDLLLCGLTTALWKSISRREWSVMSLAHTYPLMSLEQILVHLDATLGTSLCSAMTTVRARAVFNTGDALVEELFQSRWRLWNLLPQFLGLEILKFLPFVDTLR